MLGTNKTFAEKFTMFSRKACSMINNQIQRLRVGAWPQYIIGIFVIVFFLFMGVFGWVTGQGAKALLTIPMMLLGIVLLLTSGSTELTDGSIRTFTLLGTYELAWKEITGVSFDNNNLMLFAPGKQLNVPPPKMWSGPDKQQAREFLARQLELYQPAMVKGPMILTFSRNCRRRSGD